MFSWFRKRAHPTAAANFDLSTLVDLSPAQFAQAVVGTIRPSEPAARAMTVVALHNFSPMEDAVEKAFRDQSKHYDQDDALRQMLNRDMSDPIKGRRLWWFTSAMLVRRLDRLAAKDDSLVEPACDVWAALLEGAQHIPALLDKSIVWSADEKSYTLDYMARGNAPPSGRDAMHLVLRDLMPKSYREASPIKAVRERHELSLWGP